MWAFARIMIKHAAEELNDKTVAIDAACLEAQCTAEQRTSVAGQDAPGPKSRSGA